MVATTTSWKHTFLHANQEQYFSQFKTLFVKLPTPLEHIGMACTATQTAFLTAQFNGSIKIIHHLHHNSGSAFVPGTNKIWGLCGSDAHTPTVLIPAHAFHLQSTPIKALTWEAFTECKQAEDFTSLDWTQETASHNNTALFASCALIAIPAFLAKPLLEARSSNPSILAITTINAFRIKATVIASRNSTPGSHHHPT